ncbi:C-type mannose receptor 2-like [Tachysurus fulvidraco]|uniref:C-type mannose receptor 2-like n=1 Tax=Tachysurus fulvidraco TaxID=1234273 RepID=UPI000F4D713F|nr:C-type mannose receptor 2-like [Tachysurus fulvidraco]
MMPVLYILLLLAVTDASADLFVRKHIYYNQDMTWTDAQMYCRNNYVDLSVIDTQPEFDSFVRQMDSKKSDNCWIGLRKEINGAIQWTDGTILGFSKWKGGEPDNPPNKDCVFTNNNEWIHDDCNSKHKVFCYTWEPQIIVVQEMMNWEEALVYCRTNYTDLVGFADKIDYFVLNNRNMKIRTLWTNLRFMDGSWFWVNQTSLLNSVTSLPSCPAKPFRCGARNVKAGVWENRDCKEKMNFICYL